MLLWNAYKNVRLFFGLLLTLYFIDHIKAYKFLGVLHFSSKSHFFVGSALMRSLVEKGHEVTVISPYPLKEPLKNYHDVPIPAVLKVMEKANENILDRNLERKQSRFLKNIIRMYDIGLQVTEAALNESSVKALQASNQTFDAVICEVFMSEALYGLSEHFKAPLIGLGTFGAIAWNTDMVGSPSPLSYVPSTFLPFTDHMPLSQRILNLAFATFERLLLDYYYLPKQKALYKKYFPDNERSMYEVQKNASLVLLNTHVSLSYPRPYVPNQIEVGGMHINRKRTPLPAHIEKFINGSEYGVIYFSMGSNIKAKNMALEKRQVFVKVFRSLKQRVLWKFEEPEFKGLPDNVLISDWFPQNDILAHDRVKLSITHGGLLSTTESIYHGKPFIGFPIYGDQFLNMERAVANGYAISLEYEDLNAEMLREAIETILYNETYTKMVENMSQRYRDQPVEPLELATFWVEHVARQKGAKYLHSASLDLSFIEYHNIDAILFLVFVPLSILFFIVWLTIFTFKQIFCKSPSPKNESNEKKLKQQ